MARFTLDNTGKGTPMRVDYPDPTFLNLDPAKQEQKPWPELWRIVPENYTKNDWVRGRDLMPFQQAHTDTHHFRSTL